MSMERTESRQTNLLAYLSDFSFRFKIDSEEHYVLLYVEGEEEPWFVSALQLANFADDLKAVAKEACEFGLA